MIHEDITISGSFQASGSFILPRIPSNSLATATTGSIFYDSINDVVKLYNGTGSTSDGFTVIGVQSSPAAAGGGGGGGSSDVDFLVVAGGGGGGFTAGGGGGAGGLRTSSGSTSGGGASAENSITTISSGSTITVTIGAGGAGSTGGSSQGTSGNDSSIASTDFTTITSVGGGGGGTRGSGKYSGLDGGSGGGEGGDNSGDGGSGTSGQGFDGGSNSNGGTGAAGGGGAIAVGSAHSGNSGGNGGDGLTVLITGTSVAYAGGGGGGGQNAYSAGTGGTGGGGNGGTNAAGSNGTANTGGGGGGDGNLDNNGGTGGSGVVILAYETGSITAVGGTKTSTADGKFVHTFKESGTLTVGGSTFSTIAPGDHFSTVLYTGNGGTQAITGVGFKPDFVWCKARSQAHDHNATDSTRGVSKGLNPNTTAVEGNQAPLGVTVLGDDGFTVVDNSGGGASVNGNNITYVAWCWKAGGGTTSSNTDGSSTSTVQVNTVGGFSIVKYTGNQTAGHTVGHGLGVKPDMIILKCLDSVNPWYVYHKGVDGSNPAHYNIRLSETDARQDSLTEFNDTEPTTSVFSLGTTTGTNKSSNDYIAYCFASITGYQKIGSYDGTGNANNQVTVGFRPRFLIIKSATAAEPWFILDSARDTSNPRDNRLMADSNAAEDDGSVHTVDFTDTGFTANGTTGNGTNGNGYSYVYLAIA